MVGAVRFEARIRDLVEDLPDLAALVEPLLIVRQTLREQFGILHRRLLAAVWNGSRALRNFLPNPRSECFDTD